MYDKREIIYEKLQISRHEHEKWKNFSWNEGWRGKFNFKSWCTIKAVESEAKCLLFPWNEKIMQLQVSSGGWTCGWRWPDTYNCLGCSTWTTSPAGVFVNAVHNKFIKLYDPQSELLWWKLRAFISVEWRGLKVSVVISREFKVAGASQAILIRQLMPAVRRSNFSIRVISFCSNSDRNGSI